MTMKYILLTTLSLILWATIPSIAAKPQTVKWSKETSEEKILTRFLRYVSYDTQSDRNSKSYPSTAKQLVLLKVLKSEMEALGMTEVTMDQYGYVMGTIPASKGYESAPVFGLLAHIDTAPIFTGANVKPQVINEYDGKDIRLNDSLWMRVADFPQLARFKGHKIVHTDGTTLLGADDKAGVAEIMTAAEYLMTHPEFKHGKIRIGFTPDEEISRGVDFFDVKAFGASAAYTMDSGLEGRIVYENWNAAQAHLDIRGVSSHLGTAKGKLVSALEIAFELHQMLPKAERPQYTSGYEGFFHLLDMKGDVPHAEVNYQIREFDTKRFEERKALMRDLVNLLNKRYNGAIQLTIKDQYYNMRLKVDERPEIVEKALTAMRMAGITPTPAPGRGGTDGSRLSYMGLPCPNIFVGGMNYHSPYECCSVDMMERAFQVILNLAELWSK